MRRKIGFLIGLVGLVVIVALGIKFLTNRGPKIGELRVESTPPAAIFLDNKNIGRTSSVSQKIEAGSYTIKLVPDSVTGEQMSWEGKIVVGANQLTYVNANLSDSELSTAVDVLWLEKISSKESELSITTTPDGATVLVDDSTKGVTPLSLADITPGDHTVTVTNAGFLTRNLKIKMTPGYRLIMTMKLGLSAGGQTVVPTASPTATVTPSGTVTPTPKTASASASTSADPPKPFLTVKDTPTGFLRVRMEPSTGATEAAQVNPGDKFTILDTQNGWYQIRYDGQSTGWVSGQYTTKTE